MKLKKLFLSFLVANIALSPFVVSMKTEAVSPWAKLVGYMTAAASTGGALYFGPQLGLDYKMANQIAQSSSTVAEQATETISATALKTMTNSFYNILSYLGSGLLSVEKLGVDGLEKLSFSINPATVYKFFRKHHEMTAILAFLGVCCAWYSTKKISAWNAHQSELRSEVLRSINNNFVQFSQICDDIKARKSSTTPYAVLPANATTLTNAQKIVAFPFLRQDKKLYALLSLFYTTCQDVIKEANGPGRVKPDTSSDTFKFAWTKSGEIQKHLTSLL